MGTLERPGNPNSFRFLAALVPLFCGLLAALIGNTPFSILGGNVPAPLLALVPVYFWCLVRPDLMTPAATLAIGFVHDMLSGGPPGVWTLAFVLTYALVSSQRDSFASLSGLVAVVGFAAAAACACACAYVTVSMLFWHLPPVTPIVVELAMSVVCYIPVVMIVGFIHQHLVGAARSGI